MAVALDLQQRTNSPCGASLDRSPCTRVPQSNRTSRRSRATPTGGTGTSGQVPPAVTAPNGVHPHLQRASRFAPDGPFSALHRDTERGVHGVIRQHQKRPQPAHRGPHRTRLSPTKAKHLFEPFHRLSDRTSHDDFGLASPSSHPSPHSTAAPPQRTHPPHGGGLRVTVTLPSAHDRSKTALDHLAAPTDAEHPETATLRRVPRWVPAATPEWLRDRSIRC